MDYLLIFITAVCFGFNGIFNGMYGKKNKNANPFILMLVCSVVITFFFFAVNGFKFIYDKNTLIIGSLFGITFLITTLFAILAYRIGNVALSALFISYSLILPTLYGLLFRHEQTDAFFWIALALLFVSLFLINKPKKGNEQDGKIKNKRLWIIFVLLAFVGNGFCSILQTHHQLLTGGNFRAEFMIICAAVMFTVSLVMMYVRAFGDNGALEFKKALPYGVAMGTTSALVNYLVMILVSGAISVSVIFPLTSAGSLLVSYIFSAVLFKEKLTLSQNIGFVFGVAAVIFFNI